MIYAIFMGLIWLCNTIFAIMEDEQQFYFKIMEFILIIIFIAAEYLRRKKENLIYISCCMLIIVEILCNEIIVCLVLLQKIDKFQIVFFIYSIGSFRLKKIKMKVFIKSVHLILLTIYGCLVDWRLGQPILLGFFSLFFMALSSRKQLHPQIKRSEQTFEETIQIRTNSETDRFLDPSYNLISILKINHQGRLISQNSKGSEILSIVSLRELLDSNVQYLDKQTKLFLQEAASYKMPSMYEFRDSGQYMSLREVIQQVFANCKLPYEFQVLSLAGYDDLHFKVMVVDQKSAYIAIQDLKEYKDIVKKMHTQTTMHQLFKSFSHEFNTSLNYILALAQVAESSDYVDTLVQEKYFNPIVCTGKIMHSIVSDIMDYNLILGKIFNLQVSNFSIIELINEVMQLFKDQVCKKRLQFNFENNSQIQQIVSDRNRIRQVLINLISNAQKFTLIGSITIKVESKYIENALYIYFHIIDTGIGMGQEEQSRLNLLLISGVPARQQISKNTAGFGLGLFVSNKIAEALIQKRYDKGGGIRFKSEVNQGFHCWFSAQSQSVSPLIRSNNRTPLVILHKKIVMDTRQTEIITKLKLDRIDIQPMRQKFSHLLGLKDKIKTEPLKSETEIRLRRPHNGLKIAKELIQAVSKKKNEFSESINQECSKQDQEERIKYLRQPKQKEKQQHCRCPIILIADDEQINIMALSMMLEQLKLPVDSVFNGQECVNLIYHQKKKTSCVFCEKKQYELIFMDINMPLLDGIEATKIIKKRFSPVIIACTAYTDNETKEKCYASGMDYYLSKPVKRDQLHEVLQFYNFI